MLLDRKNPWTESGKPKPLPPQSKEPTSASAEPEPKADAPTPAEDKSLHRTIQDEVDKFATHVGRQLEEEISQSLRRPRFVASGPSPTAKELADAELRKFMPEQVRAELLNGRTLIETSH